MTNATTRTPKMLAMGLTLLVPLLLVPAPASASHDCASGTLFTGSRSDSVTDGTDEEDYWRHSASTTSPLHYLYIDVGGSGSLIMRAYGNSNCTNQLCNTSVISAGSTGSCQNEVWTGTFYIEVEQWSGFGTTSYTLTECHSARVSSVVCL